MKIRFLAVAGVCALGAVTLAGCDSKVGTAAVVNGHKISESTLANYVTPAAKPLQSSDGTSSVAPRTFVLQYLIRSQIFERVLNSNNDPVTSDLLDSARTQALAGGSEADLVKQVTGVGLSSSFEKEVLRYQELYTLIGSKLGADKANAALAKSSDKIVVNPRYGSWNSKTISLTDLSKAQLPSFLHFDNALPGDPPPAQ